MSKMAFASPLLSPPSTPPTLPSPIISPHLCTILTTKTYIPGLIGLCKSIELTFSDNPVSRPTLICYITNDEVLSAALDALESHGLDIYLSSSIYLYNIFTVLKGETGRGQGAGAKHTWSEGRLDRSDRSISTTHITRILLLLTAARALLLAPLIAGRLPSFTSGSFDRASTFDDPKAFVDAPRRLLFLLPVPVCYIDLDVLVLSKDITHLLDLASGTVGWTSNPSPSSPSSSSSSSSSPPTFVCHAVGNFRNKKKIFSSPPPPPGSHFNCGVTVIPLPYPATTPNPSFPFWSLYSRSVDILTSPGWNDTEEKMLNVLLPEWQGLGVRFNLQKRAYHHAPERWNEVVGGVGDVVVLHYVGGKPWNTKEEVRRSEAWAREAKHGRFLKC